MRSLDTHSKPAAAVNSSRDIICSTHRAPHQHHSHVSSLPPRSSSSSPLRRNHAARPARHPDLDLLVHLQQHRRRTRRAHVGLDPEVQLSNGALGELRLVPASTKEMGVEDRGEERVLEGDGTKQDTQHNEELSVCNGLHRGVIVGCTSLRSQFCWIRWNNLAHTFDPDLQLLLHRVGRRRPIGSRRRALSEELRHQSRARERQSMEEREDSVWYKGDCRARR